jgi:hypothetical protein
MDNEFHILTKEQKNLLDSIIDTYKKYDLDLDEAGDEVEDKFLVDCSYHQKDMIDTLVKYGYLMESITLYPSEIGMHYGYFRRLYLQDKYLRPVVVSLITSLLTTVTTLWLKGLL